MITQTAYLSAVSRSFSSRTERETMYRRKILLAGITLGWLISTAVVFLALFLIWKRVINYADYYELQWKHRWYDIPMPWWDGFHWYHITIPGILGVILARWCWERYVHCYREVLSGVIVSMDTRGGGLSRLEWIVRLEGLTRAGEERRYWQPVSAGYWHDLEVGDTIDMEDDEN